MKKSLRIASIVLAALLFCSYNNSLKAQVKIGGNPAVVDANAILELESNRKGLLLPRLNATGFGILNTAGSNPATPIKDGMLIYLSETADGKMPGFYVRQNGQWEMIGVDGAAGTPWRMNGNDATGGEWLGTKSAHPLVFKTDNGERMRIDADGNFIFGGEDYTFNGGDYIFNGDSYTINGLTTAAPAENDVLVIDAAGKIWKKTFNNISVTSLEGLSGAVDLATSAGAHTEAGIAVAGQVITLNLPTMTDPVTQGYGFITAADFQKLNDITKNDVFTLADVVAEDALGDEGAKFEWNATTKKWVLSLNAAGELRSGIVTTGMQTFAGDKTFKGNFLVSDGGLTVQGPVTLPIVANVDPADLTYKLLLKDAANEVKLVNVDKWKLAGEGISGIVMEDGTPTPPSVTGTAADGRLSFEQVNTGTDFTIKASGTNKIVFETPTASETSRGLISAADQTIGGKKTFVAEVTAGDGTGSALSIKGGITVRSRAVPPSGGDVYASDYVLLVKGSGAVGGSPDIVPVTLPDPANENTGRMFVFTRLAQPISSDDDANSTVRIAYGGTTVADISEPYTSITVMSTGTGWIVLSRTMSGSL